MKRIFRIMALAVLMIMIGTNALASSVPLDPFADASDYFKQTYVLPEDIPTAQHMALIRDGDLGDKQVPVALICAIAVVVGAGAVYVHKKRKDA